MNILPELRDKEWKGCDNFAFRNNESADGSIWLYPKLKGKNYKMLYYSGDNDAVVPTQGTQKWINDLGW